MRQRTEREWEIKERKKRKRQQELKKKIFGFCVFTFLLGVLCGRIVFAKNSDEYEEHVSAEKADYIDTDQENETGKIVSAVQKSAESREEDSWKLVLVNRTHYVEDSYEPALAEIENNYYFDARAVEYLKQMLADGRKEGLDFWICSAYRNIDKQTELYENKVRRLEAEGMSHEKARTEAATVVAYPGTSEHNLGLAVDIVARDYQILDDKQANTPEAQWLKENCWKYGFILRYPTNKTEETGIIFEPWHYRYVGEEAAKEIMEQGICLEEYLDAV